MISVAGDNACTAGPIAKRIKSEHVADFSSPPRQEKARRGAIPAGLEWPNQFSPTVRLGLFDWNKSNLFDNFLAGAADGEINKLFSDSSRLAVGVIKSRPGVGIRFGEHALL